MTLTWKILFVATSNGLKKDPKRDLSPQARVMNRLKKEEMK